MVLFGTQEWLDEYRRRINESAAFRAAAATWEGTVAWLLEPEAGEQPRCVVLELWRGECRHVWESVREEADKAAVLIRGPSRWWRQALRGELDPVRGMMQGKLRLRGDLPTVVHHVRASGELVQIAAQMPTEFPDE